MKGCKVSTSFDGLQQRSQRHPLPRSKPGGGRSPDPKQRLQAQRGLSADCHPPMQHRRRGQNPPLIPPRLASNDNSAVRPRPSGGWNRPRRSGRRCFLEPHITAPEVFQCQAALRVHPHYQRRLDARPGKHHLIPGSAQLRWVWHCWRPAKWRPSPEASKSAAAAFLWCCSGIATTEQNLPSSVHAPSAVGTPLRHGGKTDREGRPSRKGHSLIPAMVDDGQ